MGDPAYSQNIAMIATVQAQTLQELGVPYIDLQKAMASPEGPILGAGPGDTVPIRNRDGVKFLREGDRRLAGLVFARIEAEIASAGPASKNATLQQPAKPELENAPAPSPLFGQAAAPEIVNVVTAKAEQVAPAVAVPRSVQTAERVFINGLMPAAPKGRFDDFSVAAPEAPAR